MKNGFSSSTAFYGKTGRCSKTYPAGHSTVRPEVLEQMGFNFKFYTHQYRTDKGATYYFCYEWGYQVLDNGKVLIVNWQNYMKPFSTQRIPS